MARTELTRRIHDTLYKKRHRYWFTRWWGVLIVVLGIFLVTYLAVLSFQIAFHLNNITSGEYVSRAVDSIKQDATIDLLHNVVGDPSQGPLNAKVVIVAFEDFQCPYCLAAQPMIKKLLATHGDSVRFIWKDFPLTVIHPEAQQAAEAAQCANEQGKFWEFHDKLFENQEIISEANFRVWAKDVGVNINQFNECYATGKYRKSINQDIELGKVLGVVGTPTFFVNGEWFAQGYEDSLTEMFEKAIEFIGRL